MKTDVVVIGGGISGLSVAYWIQKAGRSVRVLEKDPEPGGTMKTLKQDGYLAETGPNSALETTPLFAELVRELHLEDEFLYADPGGRNRFILRDGNLLPLPLSPFSFLTTPLFSVTAKFRLLKEPFIGRSSREESIAEFVTRRLGPEFLDYAIDPFVAGVFAAKPEALSVRSAFPKLYALEQEYGGLIKGSILGRRKRQGRAEKAKDRAETFSFRSGMQLLPQALARALGASIEFHSNVTGIRDLTLSGAYPEDDPDVRRFEIEYLANDQSRTIRADAVILSIPAYAAAHIIQPFSRSVARRLSSIVYPPVASVFLGFRRSDVPHALDGFGFLVPSVERRRILGCLWTSSLFPHRAPDGHVGLTVFIGGGRQPELALQSHQDLIDLAHEELKSIMDIQGKPVYWKVTRWQHAIPQYELGYQGIMDELSEFEREHPGLYFCSNFRGGISVGDCVRSASTIARQVHEDLPKLSTR